ncbi:MAG: hypothetical protein ACETWM_09370 [Candidatus Lokiarchaeia archaeon]
MDSYFLLVNEIIAYTLGLSVYITGILGSEYLYCMIGIIVIGLPMTLIFVYRPSPKIASITNMLSLGILGMLFVLGMILGKKYLPLLAIPSFIQSFYLPFYLLFYPPLF